MFMQLCDVADWRHCHPSLQHVLYKRKFIVDSFSSGN